MKKREFIKLLAVSFTGLGAAVTGFNLKTDTESERLYTLTYNGSENVIDSKAQVQWYYSYRNPKTGKTIKIKKQWQ